MFKVQGYIDPNKIVTVCAWCGRKIPKGSEIFSLGAKVKSGIDLHNQAGRAIRLLLAKSEKTINAIAPADNSQAKKEGNDLLFAICSLKCGDVLRRTLQEELDVFDQINYPPPS